MSTTAFSAIVRKDLTFFFSDRRTLVITLVTPIAIASFFGMLFSGEGERHAPSKVRVHVLDQDQSLVSAGISAGLASEAMLALTPAPLAEAREAVRKGKAAAVLLIPKGFGESSTRVLFAPGTKPEIGLLVDPSRGIETAMIKGLLAQHVMQAVSKEAFSGKTGRQNLDEGIAQVEKGEGPPGEQGRALREMLKGIAKWQDVSAAPGGQGTVTAAEGAPGLSVPYTVKEEAVTAGSGVRYNSYAQSFAGMGVQFVLFLAIDLGVGLLLEREKGIWKRFRSAPLTRVSFLAARTASGAITVFVSLVTCFAFGILVFGIRIHGSTIGFLGLCLATAVMAATCGLFMAAIGRNPRSTRLIAIAVILILVMLGGAWIPTFIYPPWLQRVALVVPITWAMNGFSGVTWRGQGLTATLLPIGALLGYSILFGAVAVLRFRWEE
jgi:ABC-2 type transport system permease protein